MKKQASRTLAIAAITTMALTISLWAQVSGRPALTAGQLAPGFTARTTDGRQIALSDYKGQVVLLEFWASWCSVCVADLPALKLLNDKYGPSGFTVVGISLDEDPKALQAKVTEKEISWTQATDGKSFDGEVAQLYGVKG